MEGGATFFKRSTQPGYSEVTASPPCSLHLHSLLVFLLTPCLFCGFHTHIFLFLSPCISFPSSWSPLLIVAFSQISCLPALRFHLWYMKTSFLSLLTSGPPPWFWKTCFTFYFLSEILWLVHLSPVRETMKRRKTPPSPISSGMGKLSFLSQAGFGTWYLQGNGRREETVPPQQHHSGRGPLPPSPC